MSRRSWASISVALFVHACAYRLLTHAPPAARPLHRSVELTFISRRASAPPVLPAAASRISPVAPVRDASPLVARRTNGAQAATDGAATASQTVAAPGTAPTPNAVVLFPVGVLAAHGQIAHAPAARAPSDAADADALAGKRVVARLQGWFKAARDAELVRSNLIDPSWRGAERQADTHFHPTPETVDARKPAAIAMHQVWSGFAREPVSSGARFTDTIADADRQTATSIHTDSIAAAFAHFDQPGSWSSVEIETTIEPTGEVTDMQITTHSTSAALDSLALKTLRDALIRSPVHDPEGRVRARWLFAAGVWFTLPKVAPVEGAPGQVTGAVVNLFSISLDGKVNDHVGKSHVSTHVELVSRTVLAALDGGAD